MKRVSSVVWQFFDRLEENKRCVAVLCKLCDSEYKYFGNTTNLRAHLIKKHPLQWEFRQNNLDGQNQKGLEEQPMIRAYEEDESTIISESVAPKRKKYILTSNDKKIDALENSETENEQCDVDEDTATLNLVRQMHDSQGSDEEWLEEDYVQLDMYEPSHKKTYRKIIKREVVTPPRQSSTLRFNPRSSSKPQRTERIIIDDPKKDEYSVFGEYIANKLRKFKAPRTRGNIQQIITTILWQAEYGLYDDAEAVKRVLMSSIQYSDVDQDGTVQDNDMPIPSQHSNYTEKMVEECNQSADSEGVTLLG